jgi:hypothetical protein
MPAPTVAVPLVEFSRRCDRHALVVAGLLAVPDPKLQRLLAELVMMRLFDDFQEAVAGVAVRLACGAQYADGTAPLLLTAPARSTSSATGLFETLARPKSKYTKWSTYHYIHETVRHVLDPSDHFLAACQAHTLIISEMQAVRNRIAHAKARSYLGVVRSYYGASLNHVTPGVLLLSARFSPILIEKYIASCRTIARACGRG